MVVEGLLKQVMMRQLGPHLGDYLQDASEGLELELELGVEGIPVDTFEAPFAAAAAERSSGERRCAEPSLNLP